MKFQLPLLLLVIVPGHSLRIEEGCEAKSVWKLPYTWNEYHLSFWTPPASEDSWEILTIEIHFEGHIFPVTYDSIHVHRNITVIERVRTGIRNTKTYPLSSEILEGWTNFGFLLDEHYGIVYDNNTVLNASVEYMPTFLQFEGSNITISCHLDLRVWETSKTPVTLPIENWNQHHLSFYSREEFLPTIDIEMRRIQLGWNQGNLTTIPTRAKSLPPFVEHHLKLTCYKNDVIICTVMIGDKGTISEELRFGNLPKTVTIAGRGNDNSFYVFLHESNTFLPPQAHTDSEPGIGSLTCKGKNAILAMLVILAVLSVTLSTVLVILVLPKTISSCHTKTGCNSNSNMVEKWCEDKGTMLFDGKISNGSSSTDSGIGYELHPLNSVR